MFRKILLGCLAALICSGLQAQDRQDKKLQKELEALVSGFNGQVGIYVKNLKTGKVAAVNADSIFPTASMIKVPIMCGVFDQIEQGKLAYHQPLIYRDSLFYAGEDIVGSFKDGEKIALSKVQMLSITTSDNTGSLWLQKLAGGENINSWLEKNGFVHTRLNSRTAGRSEFQKKYGWGMTTPREMASLLVRIRQGEAISPAASERMYRNLIRIYFDDQALSQIPPFVQVASKSGAVDAARSEVVLVNAPHGDYVFCIATKDQQDTSWQMSNEGWVLIRKVSAALWHHFEPKSKWSPAPGLERYKP